MLTEVWLSMSTLNGGLHTGGGVFTEYYSKSTYTGVINDAITSRYRMRCE